MVRRQPCMLDTAYCTVLPSPLTVSFSVTGCERYAPIARLASYPACMALGGSLRMCLKRNCAGLRVVGSSPKPSWVSKQPGAGHRLCGLTAEFRT